MHLTIELMKRSKIDFPREIESKHLKSFFNYLSAHITGKLRHGTTIEEMSDSAFLEDRGSKTKKLESRVCFARVYGTVSVTGISSMNFEGEIRYSDHDFYLKGIKFIESRTYTPKEHQIEQIGQMDGVREQINNYFLKNHQK